MTGTPDSMPVLDAGSHHSPEAGACVMEYVSVIAGEEWSDMPTCTHPVLARAAQVVNDTVTTADERSRLLLPLVPLLMGTNPYNLSIDGAVSGCTEAGWATARICASLGANIPRLASRAQRERLNLAADLLHHRESRLPMLWVCEQVNSGLSYLIEMQGAGAAAMAVESMCKARGKPLGGIVLPPGQGVVMFTTIDAPVTLTAVGGA